ncbi:TPA: hypothetical protein DCE37_07300 [Candidatus Latescibacteria bacterium]|nr:hypothetical protein [Candidatus Latescibacterota bacterium]
MGTQQQDVRRVEGGPFDRDDEGSELIMEEAITTIGETRVLTGEPRLVSVIGFRQGSDRLQRHGQ